MIQSFWYRRHPLRWLLWPFSALYSLIALARRLYLERLKQTKFSVPIIVVGNLSVGGVGKTPLVIALAKAIQAKGLRVGIVSRGYRAKGRFPREVNVNDNAIEVGDEPLMIRRKSGVHVVIAPKRVEAVRYLLQHYQPQVIISDDGLQHYAMGRAIEIAVIDGNRGMGNGLTLPFGPLRESPSRLKRVDFVVVNSGDWPNAYSMTMVANEMTHLMSGQTVRPSDLKGSIAAVAAIGNPSRFFNTLSELNFLFQPYSFPDHHFFEPEHLEFKEKTIVMTEKDAVKCLPFATENMYYLPVTAELQQPFWDALWEHKQLKGVLSA